jgi:hypothetical protein
MELKSVQVAGKGRFIVNDNIVVYDIDAGEEGLSYSVDWDETSCTEAEAMQLAEAFLHKTVNGIMNE